MHHAPQRLRVEIVLHFQIGKCLECGTVPARDCTCVFLRLEEAQADPQATLNRIRTALGIQFNPTDYRKVQKPQGWRFRTAVGPRPDPPPEMDASDRAFMWSVLDKTQEARLGYRP